MNQAVKRGLREALLSGDRRLLDAVAPDDAASLTIVAVLQTLPADRIDLLSLVNELQARGLVDQAGGYEGLAALIEDDGPAMKAPSRSAA